MIGGIFSEAGAAARRAEGPLEMLSGLHARTLEQCQALQRLMLDVRDRGCDTLSRRTALAVLRHFDACASEYRSDEEEDLFPALLESMAGSDAVCLRELTGAMAQQHRTLQAMWERLRKPLLAVASGKNASPDSGTVDVFVALYQSHIEREQVELLPMAARLLTDEALDQVWDSMRKRHGAARPAA